MSPRHEIETALRGFAERTGLETLALDPAGFATVEVAGLPFVFEHVEGPAGGLVCTVRIAEVPPDDLGIAGFLLDACYAAWIKSGVTLSLGEDGANAEATVMIPVRMLAADMLADTVGAMTQTALAIGRELAAGATAQSSGLAAKSSELPDPSSGTQNLV